MRTLPVLLVRVVALTWPVVAFRVLSALF